MVEKTPEQENDIPIEKLLLDTDYDKYKIVPLSVKLAKELQKKEEYKHLSTGELIEIALKQILSKKK